MRRLRVSSGLQRIERPGNRQGVPQRPARLRRRQARSRGHSREQPGADSRAAARAGGVSRAGGGSLAIRRGAGAGDRTGDDARSPRSDEDGMTDEIRDKSATEPTAAATPAMREEGDGLPIRVQLPVFEGPLDLLLHLIQQNEIEITDIPIAKITRQYLETLELMRELDLEVAGEFLVMAATL